MALSPEQTADRQAFVECLTDYEGQRQWYSRRAGELKVRAQRIDIAIIAGGAMVAALPAAAKLESGLGIVVAALGVAIAVLQGAQRIFGYSETWPEYRRASERMKREARLFINGAGPYAVAEEDARTHYVEALEAIIAEEQKIFFDSVDSRRKNGNS